MFSNEVLNLFSNPKHAGRIVKPDGIEDLFNQNKSEHIEFSLRVENGIITICKFRAQAEPQVIAICETIAGMVEGKPSNMILIDTEAVATKLSVDIESVNFVVNCVMEALKDYKNKLEKAQKQKK